MAQSLRRPLCQVVGLTFSPVPRRCFSQIHPLRAPAPGGAPGRAHVSYGGARSKERSMKAMSKEVMTVPNDMGILEETFIPPTGSNAPSLFRKPLHYLRLKYNQYFFAFRNEFSLQVMKFSSPSEKGIFSRRTLKIHRSAIKPTALALHKQMYTSFAEGNVPALRRVCNDGIFESFLGRLGQRPKNEIMKWELVDYNKRPRVITHRGARFPVEGAGVIQAVVRICSKQRLTRWRKERGGREVLVEGTGNEKDVVEYVVIQRTIERWKGEEWRIWGTTNENTLDDIDSWERKKLE